MEDVLMGMLDRGELTLSVLVGIFLIWFIRSFWPGYVERSNKKIEMDRELRQYELDMEERLRNREIDAKMESDKILIENLKLLASEIKETKETFSTELQGMRAMFNDFLQNILSQFMEDRRDLIDTGIFRRGENK